MNKKWRLNEKKMGEKKGRKKRKERVVNKFNENILLVPCRVLFKKYKYNVYIHNFYTWGKRTVIIGLYHRVKE